MSRTIHYDPHFDLPSLASHRERHRRFHERRMAGFEGLVIKAGQGDPGPLVAYFLDAGGPRLLSRADCCWLGSLLVEKLLPRRNGRPRGSVTPKTAAIARAGYLVRIGKAQWCRKRDRKRASNAATESLIKRAIELVEAKIPEARGQISSHAVRNEANLRPRLGLVDDFVIDDLHEAIREIIELALK
jgi:hypothetical protein